MKLPNNEKMREMFDTVSGLEEVANNNYYQGVDIGNIRLTQEGDSVYFAIEPALPGYKPSVSVTERNGQIYINADEPFAPLFDQFRSFAEENGIKYQNVIQPDPARTAPHEKTNGIAEIIAGLEEVANNNYYQGVESGNIALAEEGDFASFPIETILPGYKPSVSVTERNGQIYINADEPFAPLFDQFRSFAEENGIKYQNAVPPP